MTSNVLIFPCGTEVGLELHKSLSHSTHCTLFGGSSVDDHGSYVFKNYITGIPFVDDESFIDRLNEVIETHKIDYIFPAHDSAVLKLARAQADGELLCKVITSPLETCEVARSKAKTYEIFQNVVPIPETYVANDLTGRFPIFLKPDVGQGSKGTYVARSQVDVDFYTEKDPTLLLLEYLPGKEYTVDCFTDKEGELLFNEARERIRISNGISVSSANVVDPRFNELARKLNATLDFRGVWFFQVKENSRKELVLMEIAPRIAGTMGLIRCKGINLALLSLFDAMEYSVDIFENTFKMVIDRALQNSYKHNIKYKHVYLDFDDLVVFDGQVNPSVMAFVYQCINRGIKIHLLTKHKHNLNSTLERHRLSRVFDELIWIQDGTEKHTYIKNQDSIFIDDSFSERKRVFKACHIPVFDSHMIEGLMDVEA